MFRPLLLAVLALVLPARAATVQATLQSVDPRLTVSGANGSGQTSILSGQMNFGQFEAFCIDTRQTINFNEPVTYTPVAYWDRPNGEAVARVVSMYLHGVQSPLEAASAQWAIWEIQANEGNNLLTGGVRINPSQAAVVSRASAYLMQYNGYAPANVQFLESPTRQDMVAFDSTSAIPEVTPVSSLMVVLVVSVATLRTRRKS